MTEESIGFRKRIIAKGFINPRTLVDDMKAGLVLGIESVPDGLAQGFLAFVNPKASEAQQEAWKKGG